MQIQLSSDAAAAAVAALEAEEEAAGQESSSGAKDVLIVTEEQLQDQDHQEDDGSATPITVTVTSGSTQYITMAGKFLLLFSSSLVFIAPCLFEILKKATLGSTP